MEKCVLLSNWYGGGGGGGGEGGIFLTLEIVGWFYGKMCFALQLVYMYNNHNNDIVKASQLIALVGKFPVHVLDLYQHCFSGTDAYCTDYCWMF